MTLGLGSAPEDRLHLLHGTEPDARRVVEILKYRHEDVAAAASVPRAAVRYDEKMPREIQERMTEWATALNLVDGFFHDEAKTVLWFFTPNPLLGGLAPREVIRLGRSAMLLKFITESLAEDRAEADGG